MTLVGVICSALDTLITIFDLIKNKNALQYTPEQSLYIKLFIPKRWEADIFVDHPIGFEIN